ncbi:MAG: CRISPR-associated endonuclease Cas1, partial [Methanomicrobiales archaeon]
FDNIDWARLETRLQAIFGSDPFVELLMAWVQAPLRTVHGLEDRVRGLPTGSPLSPVLVNLFLDDLDRDLQHEGFQATRYADDLVVQCRSEAQAQAASLVVRRSLEEKGLQVKPAKTQVIPPSQPLRFLGYIIQEEGTPLPEDEWDVGASSDAALDEFMSPVEPEALPTPGEHAPERVPHSGEGWEGSHLIVLPPVRHLVVDHGTLAIRDHEGTLLQRTPIDTTASVLLLGQHHVSPAALRACLARGIPLHFASSFGAYLGSAAAGPSRPALWLKQDLRLADPAACLRLSQRTVHARIAHQREVLRRHAHKHPEVLRQGLEAMKHCQAESLRAGDQDILRGLEGLASRHYFAAFALLVPGEWGFKNRLRHPAPDPTNALLDLASTFLHNLTDTTLRAEGLNPWCGFMHQPHGRHRVLVSDLMEPFRHHMERAVPGALGGLLTPGDFHSEGGRCRLETAAHRRFRHHLLANLSHPFQTPEDPSPRPLSGHLLAQARNFRRWVQGQADDFQPWKSR